MTKNSQPRKLLEFKKMTHAVYTAHSMANVGMSNIGSELSGMKGYNPDGQFSIGSKESNEAWATMPNSLAVKGMEKDGYFSILIAWGLIVWIYALWEDYRSQIAEELGWEANDVMSDLMGDLRHIRNWITHKKPIKRLRVLTWPIENGGVVAASQRMKELQIALNKMSIHKRESG